jgi:Lectin C-type domain
MNFSALFFATALTVVAVVGIRPAIACTEAQPTPGIRAPDGVLYDTPVYDAVSKRYFALYWARREAYHGTNWQDSEQLARSHYYKGVQGRLAIVDTPEIHSFLLQTFHQPCEAWIGLRYWCDARTLQWSGGKKWTPGSFKAWAKQWKQDVYACNSKADHVVDYMPVAYSAAGNGFRWVGKGRVKEFFAYFVEFPTGKP